ncbi:hypothetical protein A3715_12855 [Oleiphilus sp. HI0009]|uniref:Rho-binding antiterminator n=3 Tax=Oleiphilus TaxID=141450 RepID=UPI0007C2EB37|nr:MULTISPECIES: Rho-binding antiterminator [unclassified Oleiphilus]KZX76388.1 hypothetical protein A3715_12855 [Oleiphilus sp. HI0009]MCH2157915.1 Rho-binding antiterminator [Oleiphilaceae bacterium]KZY62130.1 hypothetical protein A3738_21655 [Oleiphilus sp. HI0066]KZY69942.1 hypothetical protein A3738_15575 [Oleiphilus sp. HI0066]KZY71957.1 hypothetical protein A3739_03555 [Oleiphilus sp. HI0067]
MISCQQYDYIEIACTYKLRVQLFLKDAEVVEGVVVDTAYDQHRNECVKLRMETQENLVILDTVKRMRALDENPHFHEVEFA